MGKKYWTIFFTLACCCYVVVPTGDDHLKKMMEECKEKTGVPDDKAALVINTTSIEEELSEDERCFAVCLLTKGNVIESGKLKVNVLLHITREVFKRNGKKLDENAWKKGITKCNNEESDTKCDKSYTAWMCYMTLTTKLMEE
ncbi:general odorant-binding protein 56a-like [Periplaneta americana]|uniref:general odorant-binding protein 56a-like n=1 Tax=Periplaneta americana TaxID=6978 RepID=UPI0037E981BC